MQYGCIGPDQFLKASVEIERRPSEPGHAFRFEGVRLARGEREFADES